MHSNKLGFWIRGDCRSPRRLVDWPAAFAAYCRCDGLAQVEQESYLSAFTFGEGLRLRDDGWQLNVKGYQGLCWAPWLWFDIDRDDDLDAATHATRRLCGTICDRFVIDGEELVVFFSGRKGFHVGVPTTLWNPQPTPMFHMVARQMTKHLATIAKVEIDESVYDKVRAFRAPNSRHPRSGLHKRRLEYDELMHLATPAVLRLAIQPDSFDLPSHPPSSPIAVCDWQQCELQVVTEQKALTQRRATNSASLNRLTLDFIRNGASNGNRHRLLFSSAANLAEFNCPAALAHALLSESGLDSGLAPKEVRRQIECGLNIKGGVQ